MDNSRTPPAFNKLESLCATADRESLRRAAREISRNQRVFRPGSLSVIRRALDRRETRSADRVGQSKSQGELAARVTSCAAFALLLLSLSPAFVFDWRTTHGTTRRSQDVSQIRSGLAARQIRGESFAVLESEPLAELLRRLDDHDFVLRKQALDELARRGRGRELIRLRHHPRIDVRATLPTAIVKSGKGAHALIPELAEGLESQESQVRDATIRALLDLVERHGPFRESAERLASQPKRPPH